MVFYTKSKHLMTPKIKDNKIGLTKLYFRQLYVTRKFELQGSFCVYSVFSVYIQIRAAQKDRIWIGNTGTNATMFHVLCSIEDTSKFQNAERLSYTAAMLSS